MKATVLFYSRTGTTRQVGEQISKELKCDIEEVLDTKNRNGALGYIMGGRDALRKTPAKIAPLKKDLKKYDLGIVGTPVWAGTMAPAARTILSQNKFKKIAFFAVSGAKNDQGVFQKMEDACGQKPAATLHFSTRDVKKGEIKEKVKEFVKKLK